MEFWCLSKLHQEWDDYYIDQTILHFKTKEEAINKFNDYVNTYVENFELETNDYKVVLEENSLEFSLYIDDMCDVNITLEKIIL